MAYSNCCNSNCCHSNPSCINNRWVKWTAIASAAVAIFTWLALLVCVAVMVAGETTAHSESQLNNWVFFSFLVYTIGVPITAVATIMAVVFLSLWLCRFPGCSCICCRPQSSLGNYVSV